VVEKMTKDKKITIKLDKNKAMYKIRKKMPPPKQVFVDKKKEKNKKECRNFKKDRKNESRF